MWVPGPRELAPGLEPSQALLTTLGLGHPHRGGASHWAPRVNSKSFGILALRASYRNEAFSPWALDVASVGAGHTWGGLGRMAIGPQNGNGRGELHGDPCWGLGDKSDPSIG